jgi:hypothetical protein
VGRRTYPCREDDVEANVAIVRDPGFARVDSHAHASLRRGQPVLSIDGRVKRSSGTGESQKERVPLAIDFDPTVQLTSLADEPLVSR